MAVPVSHTVGLYIYHLIKILNKRTTQLNYVTKPKVGPKDIIRLTNVHGY